MNTEELIKKRYQGDQGREYRGKKREIPENAFPWVTQLRFEKIAPYVKSQDVVMEYGVGFGWNIAKLEDHSVDVLVCHHVLEHVPSPIDVLAEIKRLLKPAEEVSLVAKPEQG